MPFQARAFSIHSISIISDEESAVKNSNTVIGIVRDSLEIFRLGHPEIKTVAIRFDNAGCYKAKLTINALHSLRSEFKDKGLEIVSINFNEPG